MWCTYAKGGFVPLFCRLFDAIPVGFAVWNKDTFRFIYNFQNLTTLEYKHVELNLLILTGTNSLSDS